MSTARQSAEIRAYLHQLADQAEHPSAAGAARRARLADMLRELADRPLVQLPTVDPRRDDLTHWHNLPDEQLRNENGADAWNLAAGLHVEQHRHQQAARRLDDDIARFTANCPRDVS